CTIPTQGQTRGVASTKLPIPVVVNLSSFQPHQNDSGKVLKEDQLPKPDFHVEVLPLVSRLLDVV
ncbi:hypothetical protein LINPERPRIM_LOCUS31215, partial [Linum perenne]